MKLPKNINELLAQCFEEGLTQSEIMLRMNCPRKWYFRYVQRAKRQGAFSWALLYGSAIHEMLDQYYRNFPSGPDDITCPLFHFEEDVILTPSQTAEYRYWMKLANITFQRYAFYWRKVEEHYRIVSTEQEYEVIYRDFRLRGKIDLQLNPSPNSHAMYVMDHKTVSEYSRSQYDGWNFRFQFLFYAWMYWRATGTQPAGILVNGLRKPALRRSEKRGETEETFLQRINQHMIEYPDDYFQREKLTFDAHTLARFEDDTLDPILTQFSWLKRWHGSDRDLKSLLFAMNSDHCQVYNRPCEFLDLCQTNFEDFSAEYIQMDTKHEELRK
jgi:PD-(D/E)XK nuclease superfamily